MPNFAVPISWSYDCNVWQDGKHNIEDRRSHFLDRGMATSARVLRVAAARLSAAEGLTLRGMGGREAVPGEDALRDRPLKEQESAQCFTSKAAFSNPPTARSNWSCATLYWKSACTRPLSACVRAARASSTSTTTLRPAS